MRQNNRYFLETDTKIVGEDGLAIRKRTPLVESGIASVKFRKGIIDKMTNTEEGRINFVLSLVNKLEEGIERSVRKEVVQSGQD